MITLYAQLAGITIALACVNALALRAGRRRKAKTPRPFIIRLCGRGCGTAEGVIRWADNPISAMPFVCPTCVADLGSARAIMANGGER